MPDRRFERPELRPERPRGGGGVDAWRNGRTNKRTKVPPCSTDFVPFEAPAQKEKKRKLLHLAGLNHRTRLVQNKLTLNSKIYRSERNSTRGPLEICSRPPTAQYVEARGMIEVSFESL